jgi:hypothetical protein
MMATPDKSRQVAFLSVRLEPRFSYQDTDLTCVLNDIWRYMFFSAKIDGDKIVEANLRDAGISFPKRIDLTPAEYAGIQVAQDALGAYYVTSLPLNTRLLDWIFSHVDSSEVGATTFCRPPQRLATLTPEGHTFTFVEKEAGVYYTPTKKFTGNRADGAPYNVKLGFNETVVY